MSISKMHLDTQGDNVRLSMPFSKVDAERRIVSGFATLDNVDKQSDIVTSEASMKAFSKFRGNIREMHQPLSVGKMIGFKEDKYFDPESKKFYSGVYVSAYVSKGAQTTWEKVLDGTLSGFSIGGRMNEWDDAYNEKVDKTIRVIKDYDLVELSLVDNPANQFANVLSIEKVDGVDTLKGDISDIEIENVFLDSDSGLVLVSKSDEEISPISGLIMKNVGFVEVNDNEKKEMIKFLVDSAKGINLSKMTKEVSPMTDTTENKVEEAVAEDAVAEAVEVAPEADAVAEENLHEEVSEVITVETEEALEEDSVPALLDVSTDEVVAEEEVSKSADVSSVISEIKDGIASAFSDLSDTVKSLHEQVSELNKSLGLVKEELSSVKGDVSKAQSEFDNFGKRVDAVEADTAFRKSGDLGEIVQETRMSKSEQSLWGGRFLKTTDHDLFR